MKEVKGGPHKYRNTIICVCFPVTSFPYLERRGQCMHSVV